MEITLLSSDFHEKNKAQFDSLARLPIPPSLHCCRARDLNPQGTKSHQTLRRLLSVLLVVIMGATPYRFPGFSKKMTKNKAHFLDLLYQLS